MAGVWDDGRRFLRSDRLGRRRALRAYTQRITGKLRFDVLKQRPGATFNAYPPESDYIFQKHPEFQSLMSAWTYRNARNNGGDLTRFYSLVLNLKQVLAENVPGDIAELGVFRGNSASILSHLGALSNRKVLLFDTFEGFDARDLRGVDNGRAVEFADSPLQSVRALLGSGSHLEYVKGYFPDSVTPSHSSRRFCFVHLDCDLHKPMKDGLSFFYERLSGGGMIAIHDYSSTAWPGVTQAVDDFCQSIPERLILLPDKSGTALLRKSTY